MINPKICIVCKKNQLKIFSYRGYNYFRCINCGMVTTYPLPSNVQIKKHYQAEFKKGNYKFLRVYSKQYERVYKGFIKEINKYLKSQGKTLNNLKILDIGCFTGDFLYLASREGADVKGIELQSDAVRLASVKLPGKILQKDISSNPFKGKRFDIVTMFGLIEHVKNPYQLVKNVSQLVKKGGIVVIQTPNSSSFFAKTLGRYWPPYTPVEHIHLFSKKGIEILLGNYRFEPIVYKSHFKILPLAYVYNMLDVFSPELKKIIKRFEVVYDPGKSTISLPFYIGEMFIIARKR